MHVSNSQFIVNAGIDFNCFVLLHAVYRFEFLQASGGKLVRPHVPRGHQWSGDKVQRLAGQGDIYIRPTYPFKVDQYEVGTLML